MLMLDSPTRFHLVRHGVHTEYGKLLSGRAGAARLNAVGRKQAARVAAWPLLGKPFAIHASPRTRTLETASIIAAAHAAEVDMVDALDEVDFGAWNGRSFADLDGDVLWDAWNRRRSAASTPGGETMMQAVRRIVRHLEEDARARAGGTVLCVTHCDIIRGAIAHYLGRSLDDILRFDIDPGSISTVEIGAGGARVTRINEVPA
ncbi:phosphoglycerate mutase [Sphingobium baderi LL03]|uniref:Phosphoglycerate mutase n=2 Tax=Sphingobium baderi TaxID=1332080 RepID=T0GK28_9SPHN|nr:hypothetical protein L485_11625 [Sphingobium baderi LL03]KMS61094.1 phosphoglycerate mutase [Sphingobium baderi LL03]